MVPIEPFGKICTAPLASLIFVVRIVIASIHFRSPTGVRNCCFRGVFCYNTNCSKMPNKTKLGWSDNIFFTPFSNFCLDNITR